MPRAAARLRPSSCLSSLFSLSVACTLISFSSTWIHQEIPNAPTARAFVSSAPHGRHPGRRELIGGLTLSTASGVVSPGPANAAASTLGYQLQLPPTWFVFKSSNIPKLDTPTARELLSGGYPEIKADVKVARVPLATSQRDPQGLGGLATIEYFSGPQPRVTTQQVVDLLSKGYSQQKDISAFSLIGAPQDFYRNNTKFLKYDFLATRCEGVQVQGIKGKVCQKENGELLPSAAVRHTVVYRLGEDPVGIAGNGNVAEGLLLGEKGAEILYVLDISAPETVWSNITSDIDFLIKSFDIGNETDLQTTRR